MSAERRHIIFRGSVGSCRAWAAMSDLEPFSLLGLCFLNCRAMRVGYVISTGPVSSVVLWLFARGCKVQATGLFYLAIRALQISSASNLKIGRCHINIQISRLLPKQTNKKLRRCGDTVLSFLLATLSRGCPGGRAWTFLAAFSTTLELLKIAIPGPHPLRY